MSNSVWNERGPGVRVVASPSTWIEGEALRQLDAVARYPGMVACVGLPDLHPGKGTPVGAAFLAEGMIYPHLIGNDIGCGMALWTTGLSARKARPEKLAARLDGLDRPMDPTGDEQRNRLIAAGIPEEGAFSLGTPGLGNHFVELQRIQSVADEAALAALGIETDRLVCLVHSGSRGVGESILRRHATRFGAAGLDANGDDAQAYFRDHDRALAYAELNRAVCAERLFDAVGTDGARIVDSSHNQLSRIDFDGRPGWLHRKGAAPAEGPAAIIPGSRGDLTFLVAPQIGQRESLFSLAHGAGRKIARHEAKAKLEGRYRRSELTARDANSRVVCGDERLLWEEAPGCYKDAAAVVDTLVAAGLCRVIATLTPVVTFKTSASEKERNRRDRSDRRRERRNSRTAKEGETR